MSIVTTIQRTPDTGTHHTLRKAVAFVGTADNQVVLAGVTGYHLIVHAIHIVGVGVNSVANVHFEDDANIIAAHRGTGSSVRAFAFPIGCLTIAKGLQVDVTV